jgi:pyruvate dehydrogenase E1 component alpha subunit
MRVDRRPRFVEAVTYRYLGHFYGDKTSRYRAADEEAAWRARDPLTAFEARAGSAGLRADAMQRIRADVAREVDAAMSFAEGSGYPDHVYLSRNALAAPLSAGRGEP